MTVVFVSNFFNHHQSSFSYYMDALTGHDYRFIATEPMDEERKSMGWGDIQIPQYVKNYYDAPTECANFINEADVVIIGSAPYELLKDRLRKGKLTFAYSERLYKNGYEAWKMPVRFVRFWNKYGRYKNLYLLCASAFTAADYAKSLTFLGKTYKWGYFPHFNKQESVHQLICKKPTEVVELLYVSRLIPLKHPELPLQVAVELREENIPFHLTMVGNGELKQIVEKSIVSNNLEKYVTRIDFLPPGEVRNYMDKANIFLFTSDKHEGWGAVVNESMNSACAVVASSEIGSVPFLLEDGQNGLIYKAGDFDDLYRKVKKLCLDKRLREEIGVSAYRTIAEVWNAESAARRFLELIEDIKTRGKSTRYKNGPCSKAIILNDRWYPCKKKE